MSLLKNIVKYIHVEWDKLLANEKSEIRNVLINAIICFVGEGEQKRIIGFI